MAAMSRPTIEEIAALTARLRTLSDAGRQADRAEVDRFLADKAELLARISAASRHNDPPPPMRARTDAQVAYAAADALTELARLRADQGGYALVGPSARTWRADGATGEPIEPVSQAEHRALRDLLDREELTATEPTWSDTPHGNDVVSNVVAADALDFDAGPAWSAEDAAHELAADGRTLDEARAFVRAYLDDVSEQVGASVHQWGLDGADLDAIRATEANRTHEAVEAAHNAVQRPCVVTHDETAAAEVAEDDAAVVEVGR